jgi:hypothetical protein
MPRKTYFKKGKRGTRNMRKSKSMSKRMSRRRSYKSKTRKYHGRGGCENDSCSLSGSTPSNAPVWTSKGGSDSDVINKDIYNHTTNQIPYSPAN